MGKVQKRRSISVSGDTYTAFRAHCEKRGEHMSAVVEAMIAERMAGSRDQGLKDAIVMAAIAAHVFNHDDARADKAHEKLWGAVKELLARGSATSDPGPEIVTPAFVLSPPPEGDGRGDAMRRRMYRDVAVKLAQQRRAVRDPDDPRRLIALPKRSQVTRASREGLEASFRLARAKQDAPAAVEVDLGARVTERPVPVVHEKQSGTPAAAVVPRRAGEVPLW